MEKSYRFYKLDGIPCRIELLEDGSKGEAEIYESGQGFIPGPRADIMYHGSPLTEAKFKEFMIRFLRCAKG